MNLIRRISALGLLLMLVSGATALAQAVTNDDTILRQVIVFSRHGIRATLMPPATFAQYSPRPYPDFGVPPGYLTAHGRQAEVLLGAWFRAYLLKEQLLTGDAGADLARCYFRANSIQRSNVTAAALGEGMLGGAAVPVHSYALGQADPVFDPISTGVATVDAARAATEVREIYNSGTALASAYSSEFALVRSVLFDYPYGTHPPPATPAGVTDTTAQPIPLTALTTGVGTGNEIDLGGLGLSVLAADPFVMEYANGMPASDVGWGRLSADALSQTTRLPILVMNLQYATPYLNRVQSSNTAAHILRSMRQAVLGETIHGAFGDASSRVIAIVSSDVFVVGMAGMLGLHWQLPGYQPDFCAPGGTLVFELRQSRRTGEYRVRVFYTAQTFDQLRNLTPLTLAQPPATMQLPIPGAERIGTSFDVTFASFESLLRKQIGRQYVQDPYAETPPGVLKDVPLK